VPAILQDLPLECRTYEPVEYWKSDVPPGRSGDWIVDHFELPRLDPESVPAERTSKVADFARHRPGRYTRLRHAASGTDFMSDLHEEWYSQRTPIREGLKRGGDILISGLGLGLIVECLLRPADSPVRKVTVVEKSRDVIDLVAGHLLGRYGRRLQIINVDAFAWNAPQGTRFTVGWHDIWPNPYLVPGEEIDRLHERYSAACDWQGSWDGSCFETDPAKEVTHG